MKPGRGIRRGLSDIRTRTNQARDVDAPQRKFLRLADLELKRALCTRVRDASARRVAEMDKQLAEIAAAQAQMLQAIAAEEQQTPAQAAMRQRVDPAETPLAGGFTLKYGSRPHGSGGDAADNGPARTGGNLRDAKEDIP